VLVLPASFLVAQQEFQRAQVVFLLDLADKFFKDAFPRDKDWRINNCRTSEGDSPIFVGRKSGQSPAYLFTDPNCSEDIKSHFIADHPATLPAADTRRKTA
jgi:hypothetical protein